MRCCWISRAKALFAHQEVEVSENYWFIFGGSELTPNLTQLDTMLDETLSKVAGECWLGEGECETGSDCFEVACAKGYITATKTLLHLATLSSFQRVLPSRETMVRRLDRFDDRISLLVKKPADPATTKAVETHKKMYRTPGLELRPITVIKLDSAKLTDRTKAKNIQDAIKAVFDFYRRLGLDKELSFDLDYLELGNYWSSTGLRPDSSY